MPIVEDTIRLLDDVGEAYRQLIADWSRVLPTQSQALMLPIIMPGDADPPAGRPVP